MILPLAVAAIAAFLLAFANGANDNGKGVATLIGSGTMSPRVAVLFGTAATLVGSLTALVLAETLLRTFSGKGIVPDAVTANRAFPISVGLAAAAAVLLATRLALPVSTTHAIVGALVGVGLAGGIIWPGVWTRFAVPLLVAPALAAVVTAPVYLTLRYGRRRAGITRRSCLCLETSAPVAVAIDGAAAVPTARAARRLRRGHRASCRAGLDGTIVGVDAQAALEWAHLLTAAAVSFARGLNDTPKIAAILLAAGAVSAATGNAVDPAVALVATGAGMTLGGLLAARRVAVTMGRRITDMNEGEGFAANLVTAGLVIFASRLGVPVSTTHVSCGSLFGIGAVNRSGRWGMIGTIVLAWITTLPVAGAIAWATWTVLTS